MKEWVSWIYSWGWSPSWRLGLEDVPAVLASTSREHGHWVHDFVDDEHRWIHGSVRDIVRAGKLRKSHLTKNADEDAGALMKRGLTKLLAPLTSPAPGHQEAHKFFRFWVTGSFFPRIGPPLFATDDDHNNCRNETRGFSLDYDWESPFAYKPVLESALHRFFVPLLSTCPAPAQSANPFRSFPESSCPSEVGGIPTSTVADAGRLLFWTHLFRAGVGLDRPHMVTSCADRRVDRLMEGIISIIGEESVLWDGIRIDVLRKMRRHVCDAVRTIRNEKTAAAGFYEVTEMWLSGNR